jgi:hypothetical protein
MARQGLIRGLIRWCLKPLALLPHRRMLSRKASSFRRSALRTLGGPWRPESSAELPLKEPTFICSYPKSGRTWLRFIIANYLSALYELDVTIDFHTVFTLIPNHEKDEKRGLAAYGYAQDERIPLIVSSHGSYGPQFAGHDVVFIIRSPMDVLVSSYFHDTRQWKSYNGDLKTYIRDKNFGLDRLIEYLNSWSAALEQHRALVLSYEEMQRDTVVAAKRTIGFLELPIVDEYVLRAIEASAIERMRELEAAHGIPGHEYDPADENARRVRKGKVGGYREYFSSGDEGWILRYCDERLSAMSKELLGEFGLVP